MNVTTRTTITLTEKESNFLDNAMQLGSYYIADLPQEDWQHMDTESLLDFHALIAQKGRALSLEVFRSGLSQLRTLALAMGKHKWDREHMTVALSVSGLCLSLADFYLNKIKEH